MSTELTVATISIDSPLTPAGVTADDDGMWFTNDGRTYLEILGGTSGVLLVTIDSPTPCNQGTEHDVTLTPTKEIRYLVGPFPKARFDDGDNKVQIGFEAGSAVDLMKIQAIQLP